MRCSPQPSHEDVTYMHHLTGLALVTPVVAVWLLGCCGDDAWRQWIVGEWDAYAFSSGLDGERQALEDVGVSLRLSLLPDGTWSGEKRLATGTAVTGHGTWSAECGYIDGVRFLEHYALIDLEAGPGSLFGREHQSLFQHGDVAYTDDRGQYLWFRRVE